MPIEAKLASTRTLGGTTFMLELYVDDVDAAFKRVNRRAMSLFAPAS